MSNTSFHPPKDYAERKMGLCYRDSKSGKISGDKGDFGYTIERTFNPEEIGPNYSGGGGLFGTARDYLRFLKGVLASKDGRPGALISKESFEVLFKSSFDPEYAKEIQKDLVKMATIQDAYDPRSLEDEGKYLGYSPGLLINMRESKFGRSAMSGCWDGAARTMYWLDPTKGIAVSQSLAVDENVEWAWG